MAWQYVGGTSGVGTSNGYSVSLTGLTGGIASAPAEGDLVVVFSGFGNTASSAPNITGNNSGAYNPATAAQHVNDTWDTEFRSFYEVMGSTPDTSLTVTRTTNTAYGGATVVHVWRGVDAASPFIGAATPASGANGNAINPPSYNPGVADALVIAGGAGTLAAAAASAHTGLSGSSNAIFQRADGSTADISVVMGSYTYSGVAIDPAAATGATTSTSASWAGVTLAFRMALAAIEGDLASSETGSDTASASGKVVVQGGASATEAATEDAFAASGALSSGIAGDMAAAESGTDTASASGDVFVSGVMSPSESGSDTASMTGDVFVSGALAVNETGHDAAIASGGVIVAGAAALSEVGQDAAASAGNVLVQGDLVVTESGQDVFAGSSSGSSSGDMAAVESGADGFAADGSASSGAANRAGFEMGGRVYIKRGRKIHIFDTVEDADAWETAEAVAQEAIAKAKTRTAKRRIVRKVEAAIEHEVLRLDLLDALVARFNLKLDLPSIEARQDWAEYVRIAMLARELEDEEEIESLLLLM